MTEVDSLSRSDEAAPAGRAALDRRGVRWAIHAVLAALGLGALALLAHRAGTAKVLDALRAAGPMLGIAFVLEGARLASDAWRTQLLYRANDRHAGWRRLLATQLASYPIALLVPAGGAASEAFKATTLAKEVGTPVAVAAAAANQSLALFSNAIISIPCIIAAFLAWGVENFTVPVLVQAVTAVALGLAIQLVTRRKILGRAVGRFSAKAGKAVDGYRAAAQKLPFIPLGPLAVGVLGRAFQLAQFAALLYGAGAPFGARSALLGLSVQLVGGAAGDMVPAQVGVTDGSFALAAKALGILSARAVMIPIAMHVLQLTWALIGAASPLGRRREVGRPARASSDT